jgi:hypothetical protein
LLEVVDACAGDLARGLDAGRHGDPFSLLFADIFRAEQHLAVLFDQRGHQLVDRLEIVGKSGHVPIRHL